MNRIKDYKQLATDITTWIRDYVTTNNIKSLVVGVSGGIDSAVVSTLCAMTGLPTYCCIIPTNDNVDKAMKVSYDHIHWLQDTYSRELIHKEMISIGGVVQQFKNVIENKLADNDHGYVNLKSRMRMSTLYYIACIYSSIVVGTGNKVEDFGVGFYTKYGDGGVDISPIADLYKTEVRELGRYLGISQEILDAAPTDGLWSDGRTDEQQIGATYEELEWAMEMQPLIQVDNHHIPFDERQQEILNIYHKLNTQNQHKMLPIPIYKLPA